MQCVASSPAHAISTLVFISPPLYHMFILTSAPHPPTCYLMWGIPQCIYNIHENVRRYSMDIKIKCVNARIGYSNSKRLLPVLRVYCHALQLLTPVMSPSSHTYHHGLDVAGWRASGEWGARIHRWSHKGNTRQISGVSHCAVDVHYFIFRSAEKLERPGVCLRVWGKVNWVFVARATEGINSRASY